MAKFTVTRRVVDEPREGESGTIYEYVIKNEWGQEIAVTFDDEFAQFVKDAASRAAISKAGGR